MLVKEVISIGTKIRIKKPIQRLCASIKTYSTSSGSSSDSSSDSDSDTEHAQKIKKYEQHKTVGDNSRKTSKLDILIDKMMQASDNNDTKTMNIAIPLKETTTTKKKLYTNKNTTYETQLLEAVKNLSHLSGKDKTEIDLELLAKLSNMGKGNTKNTQNQKNLENLKNLITNKEIKKSSQFTKKKTNEQNMGNIMLNEHKRGIIHELKAHQEKKKQENATYKIRNMRDSTQMKQYQHPAEQKIWQEPNNLNLTTGNYTIFKNMEEHTAVSPDLSVWKSLEQRELTLLFNQSPQNIFQEMIQWTESGKLWTFPIDNEYGMEQEHNVHFSEHVFLERHLKDWCPKRGPVRHFMELVCIGLSKNPYMTVDEKIEHITWYKEYFTGKEELLKELGAIDVSSSMKKQIEI